MIHLYNCDTLDHAIEHLQSDKKRSPFTFETWKKGGYFVVKELEKGVSCWYRRSIPDKYLYYIPLEK